MPPALSRKPAGSGGPAVLRPLDQRRGGAKRSASCRLPRRIPKRPRSPTSSSISRHKSAAALACALAAARGAYIADVRRRLADVERALSRTPHADARRQRRARRVPRQTPTAMGAPLMATIPPVIADRRALPGALRGPRTRTPSSNGKRRCRVARRSATCRSTSRASSSMRQACYPSASSAAATRSK